MVEGQEGITWPMWRSLAQASEEAGIEALFVADHYLSMRGRDAQAALDAWTVIAALAAVTRRLRFGTMVSPVTFRHPAVLAKTVATIDHISGGRVEVGLGAGWAAPEHRDLGIPFPGTAERMQMLTEQLEVLHRFWTGEAEPFEGRHYRTGAVSMRPPARPTVLVGGEGGPRTVQLAARWADEYNTIRATLDECGQRWASVREAWAGAGRDPATARMSLMTTCVTGQRPTDVANRLRRVLDRYGGSDPGGFRDKLEREAVIGTVDEVSEHLGALRAVGVGRIMLRHMLPEDIEMVELLGRLGWPVPAGTRAQPSTV
jgi:alkanesulfonate monooxygenase SsuD/methylene tetrahydromethanopterin reductase-like flavin-dependent oxidoreductase (luciferase family)